MKRWLSALLLVFVLASSAALTEGTARAGKESAAAEDAAPAEKDAAAEDDAADAVPEEKNAEDTAGTKSGKSSGSKKSADPATSTDLDCTHPHAETTLYFDSPGYVRIDDRTHRVYGTASADTVCPDCGELLSSETIRDAEEIRPHSFKNGVCVLCGARKPDGDEAPEEFPDAPGEHTVFPAAADPEDPESILILVVTEEDLAALEAAETQTLLIRPEETTAAIALPVSPLREKLVEQNSSLQAEMQPAEDGSVYAALHMQDTGFTLDLPATGGIHLRFYQDAPDADALQAVRFVPENPETAGTETGIPVTLTEAEAPAESYYRIPWQGNGTYIPGGILP